jgi:RNA polymerase sigma factor (TIGR02999 family)
VCGQGHDSEKVSELMARVYEELHGLARRMHRHGGRSVHATSVVHEAFLKLSTADEVRWGSRAHFLALAARVMRQVLADRARRKGADKRGGGWHQITLDGVASGGEVHDVVALHRAMEGLEQLDEQLADVARMKLLGGMTTAEMAEVSERSVRTIERQWRTARAWLIGQLKG